MKLSEICEIVNNCEKFRSILYQVYLNKHTLTESEIQEICELLRNYRDELREKVVE